MALPVLLFAVLASSAETQPPDEYLTYRLPSFEAPGPTNIEGDFVRLSWGATRQRPGLLTLSCSGRGCFAEARHTDGRGTYRQGVLASSKEVAVVKRDVASVLTSLQANGFWRLEDGSSSSSVYTVVDEDGEEQTFMCIHAPSYHLEARIGDSYHRIFRHCSPPYDDGLEAAGALIGLFWEKMPDMMEQIAERRPDGTPLPYHPEREDD